MYNVVYNVCIFTYCCKAINVIFKYALTPTGTGLHKQSPHQVADLRGTTLWRR